MSKNRSIFTKIFSFFQTKEKSTHTHTSIQTMNKAYFSPGNDCVNAIIDTLRNAKKSVNICVFTISDDKITAEIIACHRKGISVKVLTDNEKLHDLGSDIEKLAKMGLAVRIDNTTAHMHHKFMIVDNQILVNGSYNWTRSAALSNEENIIVSDDKNLVAAFSKQFEKMWKEMEVFK